jgi:hypothetical protein
MEGRVTANVGLAPVVAVLLVALAGESVISAEAREDTNCLAAPGAQAPPGRHWFYRIDRPKQRKCWYLRAQKAAEATARAPMRHRLRIASAAPEARLPSPSDQLVPEIRLEPHAGPPDAAAADERTAPLSVGDGVQAPRSTEAEVVAAPVASAPVISDTSAALGPRPSDDPAATMAPGAAERIRQAHAARVTAAQPDARARDVENGNEEAAEPMPTAAPGHVAALAFVFAGAVLVIAGIFLHPIVQVFTRRPVFRAEGTAPVSGFFGRRRDAALRKRELRLDEI